MKADFPTLLISRVQPIKIISTTERHALIWLGPKCCFVTSRQQVPRGFGFLWMGDPRRGQVVVEATRQRAAKLGLFALQGSGEASSTPRSKQITFAGRPRHAEGNCDRSQEIDRAFSCPSCGASWLGWRPFLIISLCLTASNAR